VSFSPDGKRLAKTGKDAFVRIWDSTPDREALLTLPFRPGRSAAAVFTADGTQLVLSTGDGTIKVFDAWPLTPEAPAEREALGVLEFLFTRPLCKSDVLDHLRTSPTITPAARQQALELIERYHEEADLERYYRVCWALPRQPYLNAFRYRYALRQARTACERGPADGRYQIALGVALYRAGQYPEALAALQSCNRGTPGVLAFLAMAQHRTGQQRDALATSECLRQLMKKPECAMQDEARGFLHEAESLVTMR
jgi:tetratricopeptide (TPR) repeat protein